MIRSVLLSIATGAGAVAVVGCGALDSDSPAPSNERATAELRANATRPATLTLPGDAYYPESITASLGGALYVSSITTGEIVRFASPSSAAEVFVPAGVNVGTAGVAFDDVRQVLWACAVDLTFSTPTALRAFSARTGALVASYTVPDGGVCGDITLARGDVYITDTLLGLLFKLTTPAPRSSTGGTLALWSADPAFTGAGFLQINGIAFDGGHTLYTTHYSTGALLRVAIQPDGSAGAAAVIQTSRALTTLDGIRIVAPFTSSLFVTENTGALSRVDIHGDTATVTTLGTFDQPTSVIRTGGDLWVTEGQDLRLQGVDPTPVNLPFVVRRFTLH
jgi:sugar lactone lactonase YvrE